MAVDLELASLPPHLGGGPVPAPEAAEYACPDQLPATASAMSPCSFREWMHFTVRNVGADGAVLRSLAGGTGLCTRSQFAFTVTVPFAGTHEVSAVLRSIRRQPDGAVLIRVRWIDPPRAFLIAVAEYLMIAGTGLTPARLRAGGLPLRSAERAVTFGSAVFRHDADEILDLRLRAHQHEGRLPGKSAADLASPFDANARHLVCRYAGRIVGYVRVIFVDGDPARSQYITWGGHRVPSRLWDAGFAEGGAGAVDPEFQRAGLFVPLIQHAVLVTVRAGFGHLLGGCEDDLLDLYRSLGFEVLETREVEPRPGWRFRSHLLHLDIDQLVRDPARGNGSAALASAALFARSLDRDGPSAAHRCQ